MNTLSARRLARQIAEEQAQLDGVNRLLGKERFWEKQYTEQIQVSAAWERALWYRGEK